jgi:hypothetical protein
VLPAECPPGPDPSFDRRLSSSDKLLGSGPGKFSMFFSWSKNVFKLSLYCGLISRDLFTSYWA